MFFAFNGLSTVPKECTFTTALSNCVTTPISHTSSAFQQLLVLAMNVADKSDINGGKASTGIAVDEPGYELHYKGNRKQLMTPPIDPVSSMRMSHIS